MGLYLAFYGLGRFWVEGLRVDPADDVGPFRWNQWVALGAIAVGLALFFVLRRRPDPDPVADFDVDDEFALDDTSDDDGGGVADDDADVDRDADGADAEHDSDDEDDDGDDHGDDVVEQDDADPAERNRHAGTDVQAD